MFAEVTLKITELRMLKRCHMLRDSESLLGRWSSGNLITCPLPLCTLSPSLPSTAVRRKNAFLGKKITGKKQTKTKQNAKKPHNNTAAVISVGPREKRSSLLLQPV